ncbi:hypothetical protein PHMEG_00019261, partial [Phytophthora megakarya]
RSLWLSPLRATLKFATTRIGNTSCGSMLAVLTGSAFTGGICKKSPTRTMCTPPNGTPRTCLYRRSSLSTFSHSALLIMDTSSITRRSSGVNFFSLMARLSRNKKLARVLPPISVAAFPVSAVLTIESSWCQLEQNALTASITRLFPVPPAPPRNISNWSTWSCASKLPVQ